MTDAILTHTYPNGLVLVAEPMMSLESAAFTILVPAGSVYDPVDATGIAAVTSEMTLRGSGSRDSRRFVQALENLGVEHGESVSASHTAYSGATIAKNLQPALAIFADLLRRPWLPDDQLDSVRLVVLQELRAIEDEPGQKVMLELRRREYPDPWGRPSQGELKTLESIRIDDVRAQYQRHFRPNGTIVGVAGRFDWEQLKSQVGALLGDWQPLDEPPLSDGQTLPPRDHLQYESNQTHIGLAYDSIPYRDPAYFQAWGAVGVLSGGMSSRLFTEVREKRGLCYTVYAMHHTLRDRGSVLCYAGTSADRAQETLNVMIRELLRLAEGIQAAELDRLKARIKSSLIMQQESSSSRSSAIARDWYHLGRVRTLEEVGAIIDELTHTSINEYLAENPPGGFKIVTLGPQPLEVPCGVC